MKKKGRRNEWKLHESRILQHTKRIPDRSSVRSGCPDRRFFLIADILFRAKINSHQGVRRRYTIRFVKMGRGYDSEK